MKLIIDFIRRSKYVLIICFIFTIIPFFWLKPGELALGGDSSRLYLYNPASYLKADSLYIVEPNGLGGVRSDQSMIPFLILLQIIYFIFHSPYILMCLLYSLNIVGAFLFTYLIIYQILEVYIKDNNSFLAKWAAILGGVFYMLSPSVGKPMEFALIIHNQVFLNPMIFYLMLRFLLTQKWKYIWFLLFTTFIFSPNFTLAVPGVFAFYPLAFIFLGLYITLCCKKSLPWRKLVIGFLFFLGLQAFHLIPVIINTFDPGSYYSLRLFNANTIQSDGINYFNAILPYGMVMRSFFYSYGNHLFQWSIFIAPLSIILGSLLAKRTQKDFLLIAIFFLITTFLESANITQVGVMFYRYLFYIPGFSMFRNFYGQWQWVQSFFYSLLFGFSLFLIFSRFKTKVVYIVSVLFFTLIIVVGTPFLSGKTIRQPYRITTKNVSNIFVMDPNYKKALSFVENIFIDGKFLDLPFTEFSYQVIPGLNRGAYIGPSPTSFLTGKRDFSGYQVLEPFSSTFLSLIQDKNYIAIKRLLGLLNIRYIFYISDPKDYKAFFPELPYSLLLKVLPDSKSLSDFVPKIKAGTVFQAGYYSIYNSDEKFYLPHFYVPTILSFYDNNESTENTSFFVNTTENDPRIGYLDKNTRDKIFDTNCEIKENINFDSTPTIIFKKINPTKYKIEVSNAKTPFFLIFSDKFHKDWKAFVTNAKVKKGKAYKSYFNGKIQEKNHENIFLDAKTFETLGMNSIVEKHHIMINGYANAWYITPKDVGTKSNYEIIVEMTQQRVVYYGLAISGISLVIFLLFGLKLLLKNK